MGATMVYCEIKPRTFGQKKHSRQLDRKAEKKKL